MAQATVPRRRPPIRPLDVVVSCVVLASFAFAQPLLDLLGRNAEFFLARSSPPLDIVALALLLAVVIPLVLGLVAVGLTRLHPPTGVVVHTVLLTVLGALLALQVIDRTPLRGLPGWLEILLGLSLGGLLVAAFRRSEGFRSVIRIGSVAPVVFLALFLFASSASQLVFRAPALAQPAGVDVGNPAPVVLMVFDEFPVASLMDADGGLQTEVYPNFARLAEDGTWFPNATTVQQQTEASLPAILTGVDPPEGKLPMAFEYPASLFTLLTDSHDIEAVEAVTEMCPEYACANQTRPSLPASQRWRTLVDDLRIVAGHLFLPEDLTTGLPPIDHSWANFGTGPEQQAPSDYNIIARFNEEVEADRRVPVQRFIEGIEPAGSEPTFHFLHALLPHIPWSYLPSGQILTSPSPHPGSETTGWGGDEWLVDQALQLHLVQVQYVDALVGQVLDRLQETGQYDDALIVVVADHGVTVRPDIEHRRVATEETVGDIAAVPMFIKAPGRRTGAVDDYPARTTDLVPTIADLLDIDLPWDVDGTSLFADDRPVRTESRITGTEGEVSFGVDGEAVRSVAARKIEHFGGRGPFGLAPPGQADLLGRTLDQLEIAPTGEVIATLADPGALDDVDLSAPALPVVVRGELTVPEGRSDDTVVAVALNGEVVAVTRSYSTEEGTTAFYALMPPDELVAGENTVDLLWVDGSGEGRALRRTSP